MPRDDSGPSSNPTAESSSKAPLKRGDACLYCRKRRIRCSAEKPSCNHCTKLKRECVYDTGKPVSRVKQLEDKVAELEGLLKVGPSGAVINTLNQGGPTQFQQSQQSRSNSNGSNNDSIPPPPPLVHHSSSSSSSTNGLVASNQSSFSGVSGMMNNGLASVEEAPQFQFERTMGYDGSTNFDLSDPWGTAGPSSGYTSRLSTQQYMGYSMVDPKAVEQFDFSSLDPSFMNLINSLGATTTLDPQTSNQSYPPQGQQSTYPAAPQNGMDVDFNGPSGLTPFLDPTNGEGLGYVPPPSTAPPATSQSQNSFGSSITGMTPISIQPTPSAFSAKVSYHAYVTEVAPTPASRNGTSSNSPEEAAAESPAQKHIRENILGCSTSADGVQSNGTANLPNQTMSRSKDGWGNTTWKSWIEGTPVPPEFQGQAEAGGLMGGWFDPTDLPRVARDHL